MRKLFFAAFLILIPFNISLQAHATEDARAISTIGVEVSQNCEMVETSTFGVNFNNISIQIGDAKKYMDARMTEIETAAKDVGLQKFEIQNSSMNVYSNNYSGGCGAATAPAQYQLNGSLSYNVDDIAKASELAKKIETLGYSVNLNSNAYRQCK
jgi:hypothetical protein